MKASALEPSYGSGRYWSGRAYLAMTNDLQALEEFRQFGLKQDRFQSWAPWLKKGLRGVLEKEGARGLWIKLLEMDAADAGDKEARPPYFCAECYARLGDTDQALEWLEKAYDRRQGGEHLLFDEFWNRFRRERRFEEIVEKVGLEPWAR